MSAAPRHIIVIGAMKAGTTSLHALLSQHPQIVSGWRKELNFFTENDLTAEAYGACFPTFDPTEHSWTLDASPNYAKTRAYPSTPARIARFAARTGRTIKLIYILRDPIERADSHVAHQIEHGRWTSDRIDYDHLLDVSSYAAQLDAYAAVGLRDVLLLDFDHLAVGKEKCRRPAQYQTRLTRVVTDALNLDALTVVSPKKRKKRSDRTRMLPLEIEERMRADLRDDIRRMVEVYGFKSAERWLVPRPPRVSSLT